MPRYEFEQSAASAAEAPARSPTGWRAVGIVRGCGFALMIFGFVVSLTVMLEAWSLYRSPTSVDRLAKAIEKSAHLDRALTRASRHATPPDEAVLDAEEDDANAGAGDALFSFRFSYFVAWVIAILLLLLIGRLAIAAVKTGGELVLYERHVQRLAAEIVREARRQPR